MKHAYLYRISRAATILLMNFVVCASAGAVEYTLTDIGVIGQLGDPAGGQVVGLNKNGAVAGWSQFFSPAPNQIWNGGTSFTDLPLLQSGISDNPAGINNADGVVRTGFDNGGCFAGCAIWWPAVALSPVKLDTRQSGGNGLNNTGAFVGHAYGDDGVYHATKWGFVLFGIVPVNLNNQTNHYSDAYAINDAGTAVGIVSTNSCNGSPCTFKPVVE